MLELRRVCKSFSGIRAVDNVSFTARPGEVTGYLGPNGSGKSTTMKMITGLIEMTSGEILFDGQRIQHDLIAYKRRMGYVPEEPYLYPHLTGLEYLVMIGQLRNLPAKRTADRIDGLLRLFSLHGDRHVPLSSYSKGMRQKILLSAALLHNPDLILLDEPFSGLDVASALVMRTLIQELAACGTDRPHLASGDRRVTRRMVPKVMPCPEHATPASFPSADRLGARDHTERLRRRSRLAEDRSSASCRR